MRDAFKTTIEQVMLRMLLALSGPDMGVSYFRECNFLFGWLSLPGSQRRTHVVALGLPLVSVFVFGAI